MKRFFLISALIVLFLLSGCDDFGNSPDDFDENPGGDDSIELVSLSGADGFALVWNSPAKLTRFDDGVASEVEWITKDGDTVSAEIDAAKLIAPNYMLIEYVYKDETFVQFANIDTGELVDAPAPDNYGNIVVLQGVSASASLRASATGTSVCYVASSQIVSVAPDTGSSSILSGDESVPSSAVLAVNDTMIPFAFSSSYKKSFPTTGDYFPHPLEGSPSAVRYYEARVNENSTGTHNQSVVYDDVTNTHYLISWNGGSIREIQLDASGEVYEPAGASFTSPISTARRIGYGQATPDNSYFTDGYDNLYRITDLDPFTLEAIPLDKQPGIWVDEAMIVDGKFYYKENTDAPTTTVHIRELDIDTGVEREIFSSGIDSLVEWEVVGGAVVWIDDSGSWSTDLETLVTTAYSASDVEAVTE